MSDAEALHPQLQAVVDDFTSAEERLRRLAAAVPAGAWLRRPDPARWSVAECVAHLNLTAEVYLPLLEAGLARARALGKPAPARYRRDPVGWLLWRTMGPPVRRRFATTAAFIPEALASEEGLLETFSTLQAEQVALVRAAHGLPLHLVRIASPFDPRVRYNLYACLGILPRHQHRHLWQAEQVLVDLSSAR